SLSSVLLHLFTNVQPFSTPNAQALDATIRRTVAATKPGEYALFFGLDPVLQEGVNVPTLAQLDGWAPDMPLLIRANSGHAAYANSAAMQRAGITKETPQPAGGKIVRDAGGMPTGEFQEEPGAALIMAPLQELMTPAALVEALRWYAGTLTAAGVTTVSDHS